MCNTKGPEELGEQQQQLLDLQANLPRGFVYSSTMSFLHWVQQSHPGKEHRSWGRETPLPMALTDTIPRIYWNKSPGFCLVSGSTGFDFFLVTGLMWETGSLLKVSRKVAALCHNLCSLFSQQIILHLQKHRSLCASLLCLGGEEKSPPELSRVGLKVRSH